MIMELGAPGNNGVNKDMRIKNLVLDFPAYNSRTVPPINIDGGYIKTFEIGSVNHIMEYLDVKSWGYEVPWATTGVNKFEGADFTLQIAQVANQKEYEGFASIFDFIAHSGCSILHFSFDLIDMGCQDPEKTIKHYDYNVDWKEGLRGISNLNQKVGMDSKGNLCLVISEKYDLKDVFYDTQFIDMPDVIECNDENGSSFSHLFPFYPLSAILNPNKLRVLRLDANLHLRDPNETFASEEVEEMADIMMTADPFHGEFQEIVTFSLCIGNNTIELSQYYMDDISQYIMEHQSMEQPGPYIIASTLLNAINCCLGGPTYRENESLYEDNIIDIEGRKISFILENSYGCTNSLDATVTLGGNHAGKYEKHTDINITEFIPELIAEINDELDFWSESNENNKEVLVHLMKRLMELFENKIGLN